MDEKQLEAQKKGSELIEAGIKILNEAGLSLNIAHELRIKEMPKKEVPLVGKVEVANAVETNK